MGQLERYGLYVLCLLIVLIMGVTIWGGEPMPPADTHLDVREGAAAQTAIEEEPLILPQPEEGFFDPVQNPAPRVLESLPPTIADADLDSTSVPVPAPASAAPTPRAEAPAAVARTYEVQPGDSFSEIASAELGSVRYTDDIARANPGVDSRKLRPGMVLNLPAVSGKGGGAKGSQAGGGSKPARKDGWVDYKVRPGDNPSKISETFYGTPKHAERIMAANNIVDATKLRPEQVLRIPPVR